MTKRIEGKRTGTSSPSSKYSYKILNFNGIISYEKLRGCYIIPLVGFDRQDGNTPENYGEVFRLLTYVFALDYPREYRFFNPSAPTIPKGLCN